MRADALPRSSSQYADIDSLSTSVPMRIWQQAGLNSTAVKQATIVSWMYCGTYFTRELMHTMHKAKTSSCACNPEITENVPHILLHCPLYNSIREDSIPKFIQMKNKLAEICDEENLLVISILDPLSSKLSYSITANWSSVTRAYEVARKLCYRIHSKREKIYMELDDTT